MNLALDSNHDIFLTDSGQLSTVSDSDELTQRVQTRLLTFLGEWWLDIDLGVPYFQQLLGFKPDLTRARGIFNAAILAVPGITSVDRLELSFDNPTRLLRVQFEASGELGTASGEVTI